MPKDPNIELIARAVIRRGQWLLVCRNRKKGYCYLPGGHVEFGESATAALARELQEEARLTVEVGPLGLVHEAAFNTRRKPHHELNLVFHAEWRGTRSGNDPPDPVESLEPDIAFEWLDVASLVDSDLRPEAVRAWLLTGALSGVEWVSSIPRPDLS